MADQKFNNDGMAIPQVQAPEKADPNASVRRSYISNSGVEVTFIGTREELGAAKREDDETFARMSMSPEDRSELDEAEASEAAAKAERIDRKQSLWWRLQQIKGLPEESRAAVFDALSSKDEDRIKEATEAIESYEILQDYKPKGKTLENLSMEQYAKIREKSYKD